MFEYLSNPLWGFIGVIMTIIAIFLFYRYQKRKILGYDYNITPLITEREELKGKIQILFNRKEIKNVFLATIKLFNAGNVEIPSKDYKSNIKIDFGENIKVLTAELTDKSDKNMDIKFKSDKNQISISPFLLNNKEYISFKSLITGKETDCDINTRIKGGKIQLIEKSQIVPLMKIWSIFTLFGVIIFGIILFILTMINIINNPIGSLNWFVPAMMFSILLIVVPLFTIRIIRI